VKITTTRRLSQAFFLSVFLWFCVVSSLGQAPWQLRGWPVGWFLQLDPLVALSTALSQGALPRGLLWSLVVVGGTLLLGRFFCGWVCPLGTLNHFIGWLGSLGRSRAARIRSNRIGRLREIKLWVLTLHLAAASGSLLAVLLVGTRNSPLWAILLTVIAVGGALVWRRGAARTGPFWVLVIGAPLTWFAVAAMPNAAEIFESSLQAGLLDPIPLLQRSVNLVLLPLVDGAAGLLAPTRRWTVFALPTGLLIAALLAANIYQPRFFCRVLCPLGALLGLIARLSPWRAGHHGSGCTACNDCEPHCQGACSPGDGGHADECLLCLNCLDTCPTGVTGYQPCDIGPQEQRPVSSRRGVLLSLVSGISLVPLVRLGGGLASRWHATLIRPPGSVPEPVFLARCISCGQCMRVCPTNVLQPAGTAHGPEGLWTPVLDFRIGSSGCQLECVACGHVCPTAAIEPLSLDQKHGRGRFAELGPVRVGTAFIDRGRCLPWAMGRPCIVCQEVCPVSPKAIRIRTVLEALPDGTHTVTEVSGDAIILRASVPPDTRLVSGECYCLPTGADPSQARRVISVVGARVTTAPGPSWDGLLAPGSSLDLCVRLDRPSIDPVRCTGCGICEHECPVGGRPAVQVTADGESREENHVFVL
jgi:ferredoxin